MFTTGSKLFIGATALTLLAAVLFGVTTGGDTGWTATIGLVHAAVALVFLTAINFHVRDSNVGSLQSDATTASAAARRPVGASIWPMLGAFGAGLFVVGLVTVPVVFQAGLVVLLATVVEWMVQGWSERASGDARFNAAVRGRTLHPIEFPVLAGVGLAVVIYSFSRIMLFVSKEAGPAIFAVLAALVLVGGFLIASRATLRTGLVTGVCAIAGLGLVSTGAVMAIDGERDIHEHEIIAADPDVCASNEEGEVDEKASQTVGADSSVYATVVFTGQDLVAELDGIDGALGEMTVPRSLPSNIIFENESDEEVRLTATLGAFETDTVLEGQPVVEEPLTCTALVEPGGRQFLTLIYPKSSAQTLEPYTLTVPGVEAATVRVIVP